MLPRTKKVTEATQAVEKPWTEASCGRELQPFFAVDESQQPGSVFPEEPLEQDKLSHRLHSRRRHEGDGDSSSSSSRKHHQQRARVFVDGYWEDDDGPGEEEIQSVLHKSKPPPQPPVQQSKRPKDERGNGPQKKMGWVSAPVLSAAQQRRVVQEKSGVQPTPLYAKSMAFKSPDPAVLPIPSFAPTAAAGATSAATAATTATATAATTVMRVGGDASGERPMPILVPVSLESLFLSSPPSSEKSSSTANAAAARPQGQRSRRHEGASSSVSPAVNSRKCLPSPLETSAMAAASPAARRERSSRGLLLMGFKDVADLQRSLTSKHF
mgnify:CR=1 FL=1